MLLIAHVAEVGESFVAEIGERQRVCFLRSWQAVFQPAAEFTSTYEGIDRGFNLKVAITFFAICFLNGFTLSIVITFST